MKNNILDKDIYQMNIWEFIDSSLQNNQAVVLMVVLHSEGSSPGRQGFKMAVNSLGAMNGSIGGGFMEHKLIELSKSKIDKPFAPFVKKQIHRKDAPNDQSGMICSGEQLVAFYWFDKKNISLISDIVSGSINCLEYTEKGIQPHRDLISIDHYSLSSNEQQWSLKENLILKDVAYIIGGGHVGLALSQTLNFLGFEVQVFDDRKDLNTMQDNVFADKKQVVKYEEIENYIPEGNHAYVIIMSFGYRTDEIIIKRLLGRNYKYLGMLGSEEKIRKLFASLIDQGFSKKDIDQVFSPIGLKIHSKTPEEISISIAAEIIKVKNRSN